MDTGKKQVGIVSFGYGGCASEYEDVYARVSTYAEWIDAQMTDDFCPTRPPNGGGLGGFCNFLKSMGYLANVQVERVANCFSRLLGA